MPVKLTEAQRDALADCVAMLIDLARKHRQQRSGAIDALQEEPAPPDNEAEQRLDSYPSKRTGQA